MNELRGTKNCSKSKYTDEKTCKGGHIWHRSNETVHLRWIKGTAKLYQKRDAHIEEDSTQRISSAVALPNCLRKIVEKQMLASR